MLYSNFIALPPRYAILVADIVIRYLIYKVFLLFFLIILTTSTIQLTNGLLELILTRYCRCDCCAYCVYALHHTAESNLALAGTRGTSSHSPLGRDFNFLSLECSRTIIILIVITLEPLQQCCGRVEIVWIFYAKPSQGITQKNQS